jgi:hypothetical protein
MMAVRKKASRRHKTTGKTTGVEKSNVPHGNIPATVPQAHGGALRKGGTPGNAGGTGRPKDRIRSQLTADYEKNLGIVDAIATGELLDKMEIPLLEVLQHVKCPKCQGDLQLGSEDDLFATVMVKRSPSPKDRLGAVEHQGKYSIGAVREISVDNVREKLEQQITLLRNRFSGEVLTSLLLDLKEIWNG